MRAWLHRGLAVAGIVAPLSAACVAVTEIGPLEGDPLNPETHRAFIVAVDAVLFEDGGLTEAGRDEVVRAFGALRDVASADPKNTIAMALGRDLERLAAVTARAKAGTTLLGSDLRRQWLRIRSSLFDDAWWFRRSSADPIERAQPGPPAPSALRPATGAERAALDAALRTVDQVRDLATQDLSNAYDSEPHRQFVSLAGPAIGQALERLGPAPEAFGVDVSYAHAHRSAAESLRLLRTLTGLGAGAPRSSREYLIEKAGEHLATARRHVESMMMK
jgi:hypothetical protein